MLYSWVLEIWRWPSFGMSPFCLLYTTIKSALKKMKCSGIHGQKSLLLLFLSGSCCCWMIFRDARPALGVVPQKRSVAVQTAEVFSKSLSSAAQKLRFLGALSGFFGYSESVSRKQEGREIFLPRSRRVPGLGSRGRDRD